MKIGVIADTHLSEPTESLIKLARGAFSNLPLILHAGDLTSLAVLDVFAGKKVVAVSGNKDRKIISDVLPQQQTVQVNGYNIGLIHGWGRAKELEERIIKRFKRVHCIVYGHSHRPANHIRSGILMFNPGSFSGSLWLKRNRSFGILDIDDGISGTIIPL
jgi:uncharacterized protein